MNTSATKRIAELDGLRGVAIALVLWHHLVEAYLPLGPSSWLGWLRAGTCLSWSGVDLFFVLSGYFIGGILIDRRSSPHLARTFYLRRAARILPLYYATLAASLVLIACSFSGASKLFSGWIYGLFLTNFALSSQNTWDWFPLSVLWSIAVEEQFYLAAPWVARWISPARLPVLLILLIALAWLLRAGTHWFFPGQYLAIRTLMPLRMDTLAFGVLLAWAVRTKASAPFFQRLARTWPVWLAATAAAFLLLSVNSYLHVEPVAVYFGYTVMAAGYALVVTLVAVVRPSWLVQLLSSRWLTSLGRYSYCIYLWHMLIGWGIVRWIGGPQFVLNSFAGLGIVLLAIAGTWLASVLSWKFFEGPFVELGHRTRY